MSIDDMALRPKKIPSEMNLFYQDKFRFVLDLDRKTVEFFCYKVSIPGISMNYQRVPNPVNQTFFGGAKLDYEDLQIEFRVDEDLSNYIEIHNWLVGITAPQDTDQFKNFVKKNDKIGRGEEYKIFNDATLFSLTNASNPNIKINYFDIFPYALSGLNMDAEGKTPLTAAAGFRYNYFTFG